MYMMCYSCAIKLNKHIDKKLYLIGTFMKWKQIDIDKPSHDPNSPKSQ